jgi:hypothetical protein
MPIPAREAGFKSRGRAMPSPGALRIMVAALDEDLPGEKVACDPCVKGRRFRHDAPSWNWHICGCGSVAEHQPSKLATPVRFRSSAQRSRRPAWLRPNGTQEDTARRVALPRVSRPIARGWNSRPPVAPRNVVGTLGASPASSAYQALDRRGHGTCAANSIGRVPGSSPGSSGFDPLAAHFGKVR